MTLKRVAVFWDYASCPPADGSATDFTLAIRLRKMCREYGNVNLFKVYYGPENDGCCAEMGVDGSFALGSAGIVAERNPEMGVSALATDALCFWADSLGEPSVIVFVTANPALLYTAAALKSRDVEVGLLVPPEGFPIDAAPYSSWNQECDLVRTNEVGLEPGMKASSTPQKTLDSKRDIDHTPKPREPPSLENFFASLTNRPPQPSTPPRPAKANPQKVAQPLDPVEAVHPRVAGYRLVYTTVHDLQIPGTEPLYIDMIKDSKAMEIKTWRRQLKQMFYRESAANNPQAPSELEALFSKIEKCDGMTRNYLAFSRIGKLMTQVSQQHYQEFDYRRGYVSRAKSLLDEWEKLMIKDEI